MRDLAGCPGFLVVVPNEYLSAGSQSLFDTIGIEQAAYDSTEDVPAVHERQRLVHAANIFYHETLIFVRRLIIFA